MDILAPTSSRQAGIGIRLTKYLQYQYQHKTIPVQYYGNKPSCRVTREHEDHAMREYPRGPTHEGYTMTSFLIPADGHERSILGFPPAV